MPYSSWVSNAAPVSYEPKEVESGEVITSFSTTATGGVPNSSYAPATYVLAASGAWIAPTVSSNNSEISRPSVYTELTGLPVPYFSATDTNLVYDADANHITTFGEFTLEGLNVLNDASFTYTSFAAKSQTWTASKLNISRNYPRTRWNTGTEARFYLSTDSGITWTLILTDDYDSDPIAVTIFSHTLATVNPSSLSAYQVKVEIDSTAGTGLGSVGVLNLQLYDIWIEGIYSVSGGSGTVTSITTTGANGVTISGGSTQTITTSGTFALALGAITPTSIATGTGSFTGDVEFASSIKSPNASNSPVTIAPDGTGDVHLNTDSVRIGDNNADATIATRGTGDLIITTHEGSANEGIVRLYDGVNGDITLTPNGSGQVKVGTDQVVTLVASQTLTNKTISGSSNTLSNIGNASLTNSTISGVALGSNLNALTISSPLTGTSYNGSSAVSIGIPVATTSVNGYLSSADWTTFNNKGSGSVTSVAATVPSLLSISGSPITTSGTLAITYSGTALPVANGGTGLTTLTAGYIPYGAGTSAFGSSANLFWDSTNSRLGISSTTPSVDLEIGSNTSTTRVLSVRYSSVPLYLSGGYDGTYALSTFSTNSYANATGSGQSWSSFSNTGYSNAAVQLASSGSGSEVRILTAAAANTNPTERVRIDSSGNVILNNGSSSSGTSTATPKNIRFNNDYSSGYTDASLKLYLFNSGATIQGFTSGPSYDLQYHSSGSVTLGKHVWYLDNAEKMRLDATGLGIGTASPSNKLDVVGVIRATNGSIIANTGATVNAQFILSDNGTNKWQTYYDASAGSYNIYSTTASSVRLSIDSSGNVGIGTSSPSYKLDVSGTIHNNNAVFISHGVQGNSSGISFSGVGSNYGRVWEAANDRWALGYAGSFGGASTEVLNWNSSGNVGIGVTPSAWGSFAITQYKGGFIGSQSSSYLYIGQNTYFNGTDFKYVSTAAVTMLEQSFGAFVFYRAASGTAGNTVSFSESCRIDSSGNVGIGTSSPTNKLQVNGVMVGNNAAGSYTKGFGGILTTTSTSTPTGGSSGDFALIY